MRYLEISMIVAALLAFSAEDAMASGAMPENDQAVVENLVDVVSDNELDQDRGMGVPITYTSTSTLNATLSNNTATNTVSGDNMIAAGALDGVSGVASVIQNSGNNVIIQNSTIVNMTMN